MGAGSAVHPYAPNPAHAMALLQGTPSPCPREGCWTHGGAAGCNMPPDTRAPAAGHRAESLPRKHLFELEFTPQNQDGPKVCLRRQLSRLVPRTHTQLGIHFLFTYFFQVKWLLTPPRNIRTVKSCSRYIPAQPQKAQREH